MSILNRHSLGQAALSAVLVLAAAQGCGDDSSDNPTPPDVTTGGSNTTAGNTSRAGTTGKGGSNTAGKAGTTDGGFGNEGGSSASVGGGNEGGSGEPPLPACELPELGANGCFNCPEDGEVEQWLNRCVDGDCEPFDNKTRVPLLNADGSLPDLPN
jgi:hypothetical protein